VEIPSGKDRVWRRGKLLRDALQAILEAVPRQSPRFGILALVTYGSVVFTLVVAVGGYYYLSSRKPPETAETRLGDTRTVQVGAVWIPAYPNAALLNPRSSSRGDATEGSLEFRSPDPAAQVVSFFEQTLGNMGYQTTVVTNNVGGGTVQAFRRGGRSRAFVSVESSREGSQGRITTLYREDQR
jgi:hypothetical protein